MQFIDLKAQQDRIRNRIQANIQKVLDHGKYIMGPEISALEKELAEYVGVPHAVACSSGTDALLLALMAHDVRPGDAVFTTPFTFIATAEVISLLGATPIFVDIDPVTYNIDPEKLLEAVREAGSSDSGIKPKGIIPVDLFGLPADYDRINAIADENGLFVIEDAAQSFGAMYKERRACGLASIGCTSFFPAKPLGCYGDGGMCFTADDGLAEIMRSIRIHGKGTDKYDNVRVGVNGRLDTIQASILLAKFSIFPEEVQLRDDAAGRYSQLLVGKSDFVTPKVPEGYRSVWAQYSLLARDENHRKALQQALQASGIPTAIYYPKPLHQQTAFAHLDHKDGDFPISEDRSRRIFSIPMHPYLSEKDQQTIADVISDSY